MSGMEKMYFVALVLPEEINRKIIPLKEQMREKYGCRVGLRSPAHITIGPPCWMSEESENYLVAELDRFAAGREAFTLSTDNFSSFKPRTIFIALAANGALDELKAAFDRHFREIPGLKLKLDARPFHPHITIATRDLPKGSFAEAWPLFENKTFKQTWDQSQLSLLRHNGASWDVIHNASFLKKT